MKSKKMIMINNAKKIVCNFFGVIKRKIANVYAFINCEVEN